MPYVESGYWEPGYAEDDVSPDACLGQRLVIDLDGTRIAFHAPGTACAPYPWLSKIGNLLLAARAGHLDSVGSDESANLSVELDNSDKQASDLLGYRPRAQCWLYDENNELFFSGLIAEIDYGYPLVLTIQAGGGNLLDSELLPLRTTRMLGDYAEDVPLQHILGDWTKTQFPLIRLSDKRFFAADHPMEITKAFTAKQRAFGWERRLESDDAGNTWTIVEFAAPVPPGTEVSANGEGKLDDATGVLIENPADLMRYKARLAGRTDDFPGLRAECSALDLRGKERIFERVSYKASLDATAQSFGIITWHGGARLYPTTADPLVILDLDKSEVDNLKATASLSDTADKLRLAFDHSDASSRDLQYVELSASPRRYGGLAKEVSYPHLSSGANAETIGRPVLQRLAGKKYDVTFDSDNRSLRPGMWVRPVAHPEWMVSDVDPVIMILVAQIDEDTRLISVKGETIVDRSRVTVTAHSIALPDEVAASVDISVRDGIATLTFNDTDGRPIAGAHVSMDGGQAQTTDAQGKVRFPVNVATGKPVDHEFAFEAPGFAPFIFHQAL